MSQWVGRTNSYFSSERIDGTMKLLGLTGPLWWMTQWKLAPTLSTPFWLFILAGPICLTKLNTYSAYIPYSLPLHLLASLVKETGAFCFLSFRKKKVKFLFLLLYSDSNCFKRDFCKIWWRNTYIYCREQFHWHHYRKNIS